MSWIDVCVRYSVHWAVFFVVMVLTVGAIAIARMIIVHRERMARIEQGMDPDHSPDEVPKDQA